MSTGRARAPREEEGGFRPSYPSPSVADVADAPDEEEDEGALSSGLPGAAVMLGTHFHTVDEKGRIIIPAKMRAGLTDQFWMMLDENDNIGIYPYATGMDILAHCERMIAESPEDEDLAAAVMRITEAADLVVVESSFRVIVPELLRFHAELDKEVVTVGFLNHAILWARVRWEEWQAKRPATLDVRKRQGTLMRAAASGARRSQHDDAAWQADEDALEQAQQRAHERARDSERAPQRRKAASSGDGGRGSGVLKMSDLGR